MAVNTNSSTTGGWGQVVCASQQGINPVWQRVGMFGMKLALSCGAGGALEMGQNGVGARVFAGRKAVALGTARFTPAVRDTLMLTLDDQLVTVGQHGNRAVQAMVAQFFGLEAIEAGASEEVSQDTGNFAERDARRVRIVVV